MQIQAFSHFFLRDLDKCIAEVEAFPDEASLWRIAGDVKNPAGTLALHLAGNLQHFIGAILGQTGYVRDREREFSARGISGKELTDGLKTTRQVVEETLGNLSDERLAEVFPASHFGEGRTTAHALLHLLAHLNYHLGQLNYLRRLVAV